MNLRTVSIEEVVRRRTRVNQVTRKDVAGMVKRFWESGDQAALVDYSPVEYVDEMSARSSFARAVERGGYNIKVTVRGRRLYLVRLSNMK